MNWRYDKLRGKIKEVCGTQDAFAEKLGIGRVSLSQRLNNQLEFSQDEIFKSCEILKIDFSEMQAYFFTQNVQKTKHNNTERSVGEMEKEIVHLQKQVKELRIALLVTQVLTIVMTIFLGYQCLRSIWNYQYLLQQVSMCLESVNTVYATLQQFLAAF